MKSQTGALIYSLLSELTSRGVVSTDADYQTIVSRVKNEGYSFLTITLPALGSHFDKCLSNGRWSTAMGFKTRGGLPVFLQGFLNHIFDTSGVIKVDVPHDVVQLYRQICYLFKKVELECTDNRVLKAFQSYIDSNEEVDIHYREQTRPGWICDLRSFSHSLFSYLGNTLDCFSAFREYTPRHGPGATAERIIGNDKFSHATWPQRLEGAFPYREFALGYSPLDKTKDINNHVNFLHPDRETPVRVISVPKTMKGPRIIAVEPVAMQYCQQALLGLFTDYIGETFLRNVFNFRSQEPNRALALKGSIDGSYNTFDLKEASDRLHKDIVWELFTPCPSFRDALFASRSTTALVNKDVIELNRFASMGSATCFPVEAFSFWCLLTSRLYASALDAGYTSIASLRYALRKARRIRIFGDDIIIPSDMDIDVRGILEGFALKINTSKSHEGFNFRESCGMDAFRGAEVTPAYLKCFPDDVRNIEDADKLVTFSNLLYKKGWWGSVNYLRLSVLKKWNIPYVRDNSPSIGFHSTRQTCLVEWKAFEKCSNDSKDALKAKASRMDKDLLKRGSYVLSGTNEPQGAFYYRSITRSKPRKAESCLFNRQALVKCLISGLILDTEHLSRYDLRGGGIYKRQWSRL